MTTLKAKLMSAGLFLAFLASCASTPAPAPESVESTAAAEQDASREMTTARVFFLSQPNFKAGTDPILLAVDRNVSKIRPAHGVLDAMFQGPSQSESDRGLVFIDSGVTGYHGLRVDNGIATVYLDGNCRNGGSSVTIADLITASLKQFPSVLHVRIYDANGETQNPNGPGDSVPACLNPQK